MTVVLRFARWRVRFQAVRVLHRPFKSRCLALANHSGESRSRPRARSKDVRAPDLSAAIRFAAGLILAEFTAGVFGQPVPPGDFPTARRLYESHRYTEARAAFERLVAARPDDVEINFYLGRLAWWFDDEKSAVVFLERAAGVAPANALVQSALADAYGLKALNVGLLSKYGWAKKCLAAHERAVALAPLNVETHWGLFGYYCLAPAFAGGGHAKAVAQVEAIRRLEPMAGRIAFATLALSEGKNSAAFAEFDMFLHQTPDDYLALYQVGRCAALSGEQLDRGKAALQRCLQLVPPSGPHMPTSANVHFRLGTILEKQGRKPAADAEYAEAHRLEPDLRDDKTAMTL
jgi:tetratricopeptide (TPR) repeat protein